MATAEFSKFADILSSIKDRNGMDLTEAEDIKKNKWMTVFNMFINYKNDAIFRNIKM